MLDIPIPSPHSNKKDKSSTAKIFKLLDKIPKNPRIIPVSKPKEKKVVKKISFKPIKIPLPKEIIKRKTPKKHHKQIKIKKPEIVKKIFHKKIEPEKPKLIHEKHHHKKPFHHKIKVILNQNRHRAKSLDHLKIAKIFLNRKDLDKAKKNYSKALIHYFKMPNHEEPVHLQLRSTLKEIENQELQPHYEFHESSKKIIKLKKQNKEVSHESLDAFKQFNMALKQSPEVSIPKIKEKPEYIKPSNMPIVPISKQLMPRVEKKYEKVELSPLQKKIMKKITLLEREKARINAKLNEVNQ